MVGVPTTALMRAMGHRSPIMTARYSEFADSQRRWAFARAGYYGGDQSAHSGVVIVPIPISPWAARWSPLAFAFGLRHSFPLQSRASRGLLMVALSPRRSMRLTPGLFGRCSRRSYGHFHGTEHSGSGTSIPPSG